jgi:hypothetical protein
MAQPRGRISAQAHARIAGVKARSAGRSHATDKADALRDAAGL